MCQPDPSLRLRSGQAGSGEGRRAFYPVSLNLQGRACVVIGAADDREAIEKAAALEESGARVRRIVDVAEPARRGRQRRVLCNFDSARRSALGSFARARRPPPLSAVLHRSAALRVRCDGSHRKSGPGASSDLDGGTRAARRQGSQERVASSDGLTVRAFIENLAQQRERVRAEHPGPESSQLRRTAMIEAASGFRAEVRFEYPAWFERDDAER